MMHCGDRCAYEDRCFALLRGEGCEAKPSLNLGGVAGIASQAEAMDAVRQAVEENPVVLFMKGTPAMPQPFGELLDFSGAAEVRL